MPGCILMPIWTFTLSGALCGAAINFPLLPCYIALLINPVIKSIDAYTAIVYTLIPINSYGLIGNTY